MIWLIAVTLVVVALFALTVLRGAPYVPSRRQDIRRAFDELYQLNKKDVLVDIGSGDGVVLREVSRRDARAVGFEINPILVVISRWLSRGDEHVAVKLADFWLISFPDATTIVYTFGETRDIKKMYRKVQQEASRLGRPLWFMSYGFVVPGQRVHKQVGAHHLYKILPLQKGEA